ncbi:hypothetical protein B0B51_11535 [blood disease bacterium A2-HR MARDI]|uniref:CASP-like protein n=2 Tax=Ralstonia syzygii subsp. celebesensis TaxID=1310168 RepID=A0A1U9VIK7_9RALS|nr:hypothetical protein B0B51_11535 [blood disease bacterium A2-HR MARDI]
MPKSGGDTLMADAEFDRQHKIETYKSMISISVEAFKYLALLNGGAAAGMLAGADKLVKILPLCPLRFTLACFVVGLLADGLALFLSYWTQSSLFNESFNRAPTGRHITIVKAAVALCLLSLLAFCIGALVAAMNIHA